MNGRSLLGIAVAVVIAMTFIGPAQASLTTFQSYVGNVGLSTDGFGSTSNVGTINAFVPAGSTVVAAFLYSAYYGGTASTTGFTLNGSAVNFTQDNPNPTACCSIGSQRADVTSIVSPTINGGGGVATVDAATGQPMLQYSFAVNEGSDSRVDGESLVVVYTNPLLPTGSVGLLDGFSAVGGDSAAINFVDPLHPADPGFLAEMRIGDGFSCCVNNEGNAPQGSQASNVSVNGTQITTNSGGDDDGGVKVDHFDQNGNLITQGGNDDPFSALNPFYGDDHERYNLTAEITDGDTSITVRTNNPSNNDNIYLEAFYVTGEAGFNQPPPSVPEPASIVLLGTGLLGLAWRVRRKRA